MGAVNLKDLIDVQLAFGRTRVDCCRPRPHRSIRLLARGEAPSPKYARVAQGRKEHICRINSARVSRACSSSAWYASHSGFRELRYRRFAAQLCDAGARGTDDKSSKTIHTVFCVWRRDAVDAERLAFGWRDESRVPLPQRSLARSGDDAAVSKLWRA